MKKLLAALLLFAGAASAQTGYNIKVTLKPYKNAWVYLGHYSGKNLPIIDSARLNERSEALLKGTKKLPAGVYLIGFPDRSRNFELLIDKTQNFSVATDSSLQKIVFTASKENTDFQAYQQTMTGYGKKLEALQARKASGKDTGGVAAQMTVLNGAAKTYQSTIIKNGGTALLPTLLKAAQDPEVPKAVQQSKDSNAGYRWYKQHYWDGVAFYDDRLVRTPFFEARLDKYFEQLVYPAADSVIKEIDWMLGYSGAAPEMKKFLLIKFVNRYLNQKYMWEDKVFVHLFEKIFFG